MKKSKLMEKLGDILFFPVVLTRKAKAAAKGLMQIGWKKSFGRFWKFENPSWKENVAHRITSPPINIGKWDWFNPFYWIAWTARFLYLIIVSRPYLNLGPALPAIAAGVVFIALNYWETAGNSNWRTVQNRQMYQAALQAEDYKSAALVGRRLALTAPNDLDLLFQQALIDDKLGENQLASTRIYDLAINRQHGPAAEWLLREKYPLIDLKEWDKSRHQEFQSLMNIAFSKLQGKNLAGAKLMMSSYLSQMGAHKDAVLLLKEVATTFPEVSVTGLNIAFQLKEDQLSKEFAGMAESYLLRRLQYEPGSVQHRIDLARALVIQQREQDAFQKLSEGIELSKTEPANTEKLQAASAEVLVQFVVRLNSQGKPNETLLQRLKVVNTALRVAPNNNAVINAVIEIVLECEQNKDQQVAALRSSLLKGAAPEAVHFIMGTLDLIEGRVDSGLSHLEIAKSSGLNTPGILNNLAMALIESGKEESSERALELSNAAIKGLPDHPYLRDTRGQILFRMKRYTDAIPELEYALQAPELAGNLHRLLAESYSAIGQADLAKDHLKLHQELTQARPK